MSVGQIVYVDVSKVHANRYNPNVMTGEKFGALVDFCETHGAEQLDPIWVRRDGADAFEVIDGEHRLKAAKEVGWKRLRAFIVDMDVDDAKAFNVRKNRERGNIDAFKLAAILAKEKADGMQQKDIGKKYALSDSDVCEFIQIYEHKDEIKSRIENFETSKRVSFYKARNVMRELKHEERGEAPKKSEEIVKEMVKEVKPAIEKAFQNMKKYDKHDPERNKLVLNMLLKNLVEGLVFCPVCNEAMLECSHCHTSLQKMKEEQKL